MEGEKPDVLLIATPEQRASLSGSELDIIAQGYAVKRTTTTGNAGSINSKNPFSHGDAKIPLQFLY